MGTPDRCARGSLFELVQKDKWEPRESRGDAAGIGRGYQPGGGDARAF